MAWAPAIVGLLAAAAYVLGQSPARPSSLPYQHSIIRARTTPTANVTPRRPPESKPNRVSIIPAYRRASWPTLTHRHSILPERDSILSAHGTPVPISSPISIDSTAGSSLGMCHPDPLGRTIPTGASLIGILDVTSFPTGGTNPYLQVDIQTSYDDGQTWQDITEGYATSTGTWYFPISVTGLSWFNAGQSDGGQLALSVSNQGPIFGNKFRIAYAANFGSPAGTGTFCFQALIKTTNVDAVPGRLIELYPLTSVNGNVANVASPQALEKTVRARKGLVGMIKMLSTPQPFGSGQLLDIFFQHSADNGRTWCDFIHWQNNGGISGTTLTFPVSTLAGGPTSIAPISDGTMAVGTAQGPIGDLVRIKYNSAMGTATGPWTFQALMYEN
jgi:hypothetical protein